VVLEAELVDRLNDAVFAEFGGREVDVVVERDQSAGGDLEPGGLEVAPNALVEMIAVDVHPVEVAVGETPEEGRRVAEMGLDVAGRDLARKELAGARDGCLRD